MVHEGSDIFAGRRDTPTARHGRDARQRLRKRVSTGVLDPPVVAVVVPGGRGPAVRGNHGRHTRAPAADRADARHLGPGRARRRVSGPTRQSGTAPGSSRLRRPGHGRAAGAWRRGRHRDLSRGRRRAGAGGGKADGTSAAMRLQLPRSSGRASASSACGQCLRTRTVRICREPTCG
jgi:hypothetical protein